MLQQSLSGLAIEKINTTQSVLKAGLVCADGQILLSLPGYSHRKNGYMLPHVGCTGTSPTDESSKVPMICFVSVAVYMTLCSIYMMALRKG